MKKWAQRVGRPDIDLHPKFILEIASEPNEIKWSSMRGEIDKDVDVASWTVVSTGNTAEDANVGGVAPGGQSQHFRPSGHKLSAERRSCDEGPFHST